MQGIATAQDFFSSPRPQRHLNSVPAAAAARAYGATHSGTTPIQKATLSAHRQAVSIFQETLRHHRQGMHVEAERIRERGVALVSVLRRSVNLGNGPLGDELYRIYDYLLQRLSDEPIGGTDATALAAETMRVLTEAWEFKYKQGNVVNLLEKRAGRVGPF